MELDELIAAFLSLTSGVKWLVCVCVCVCEAVPLKGGYTLVTLRRIVTPYRDSVDGIRGRVTYQKLFTR
jgi:hypothetical protein